MKQKMIVICLTFTIFVGCTSQTKKDSSNDFNNIYKKIIESAEKNDTLEISSILKNNQVNLNHVDNDSCITLLNWCILNDKVSLFDYFLQKGADPDWQDSSYKCYYPPALILASQNVDTLLYLKLALKAGANVNLEVSNMQSGRYGIMNKSPLLAAVYSHKLNNVKLLVENQVNVNMKIDSTPSALSMSIVYKALDITMYLLENGADYKDLNFTTESGRKLTIYDLLNNVHLQENSPMMRFKKQILEFLILKYPPQSH